MDNFDINMKTVRFYRSLFHVPPIFCVLLEYMSIKMPKQTNSSNPQEIHVFTWWNFFPDDETHCPTNQKKTWSPNIHGSSPLKRFGSPFLHEAPWWLLWSHGCGSSSVSSTRQSLGMPTTLQGVQRAKNVAVWWRKWYWRWTNCRVEMGDFGRFWVGRCWIRRLRFFNFLGAILFFGSCFFFKLNFWSIQKGVFLSWGNLPTNVTFRKDQVDIFFGVHWLVFSRAFGVLKLGFLLPVVPG